MHQLKKRITALLLVFSFVLSMASAAYADETGKVTEDCVRIHVKASMDSEVYQQVNKGDQLTVVEPADENGWVKVSFTYTETGETKTGYVSADYLKYDEEKKEDSADTSAKEESAAAEQDPADESGADSSAAAAEASSAQEQEEAGTQDAAKEGTEEEEEEEEEETAEISAHVSYTATVSDSGVRIRKKPSLDSDILISVPEGEIVTVYSKEDAEGWMKVRYYDENGKKYKGYMSGEYLDINSIGAGVANIGSAVIREEADGASAITGVVPKSGKVDIYASKDNWYKIEYMDLSGWVSADCIETESESECIGYGTVTTEGLNLREKASKKSTALEKIPKGVVLQITDKVRKGKWLAATYNGMSGYVSAEYIDLSDSCTEGYIQVTASSLSLRSGAGSNYARLTTIPSGKVLTVEGAVGAWYQVTYDKFTGYVSGAFVSATTKDGFSSAADFVEITADGLTLRADATTDSAALDTIPSGTILSVSGIYDGWYKVDYNGQTGFIDAGYAERGTSATQAAAEIVAASGESSSETAAAVSGSSNSAILAYASQFVGNPYSWGGTSLTNGTDCSGFVKSVLAHFGISVPHSSSAIRGYGKSVSYSEMQPGDIVCYSGHVGIYAGNGQLLSALGKKYGITYNSVNYKKIITIRRMS